MKIRQVRWKGSFGNSAYNLCLIFDGHGITATKEGMLNDHRLIEKECCHIDTKFNHNNLGLSLIYLH